MLKTPGVGVLLAGGLPSPALNRCFGPGDNTDGSHCNQLNSHTNAVQARSDAGSVLPLRLP